jgi:hypothetical protein
MKASYPLESAIEKSLVVLALFSTFFLAYPESTVLAQGLQTQNGKTAQVFDINSKSKKNLAQTNLVETSISIADIVTPSDLLAPKIQAYLASKGSPLASLDPNWILTQNNSFRAIAISFVESNMCKRTPKPFIGGQHVESHNCSGIGGGGKVYPSYQAWFEDMNNLLNRPAYVNRPIEKFLHFYVQPGSLNWLNGVKKVEGDLRFLEAQAQQEHFALTGGNLNIATAGAPELAQK